MPCPLCGASPPAPVVSTPLLRVVRCRVCGVHYVERAEAPRAEGGEYYADLPLDAYLRYYGPFRRRVFRQNWQRIIGWKASGRALDLGASFGWFVEVAPTSWQPLGLEPSEEVAARARADGLAVRTGGLAELVADPTGYDLITLWNVLEHLPDPVGTLAIVRDHLRPGGIVALCVPNRLGLFNRLGYLAARVSFGRAAEPLHTLFQVGNPAPHLVHYAPADLRRLLTESGFEILAEHSQPIIDISNLPGRAAIDWSHAGLAKTRPGRALIVLLYALSRRLHWPDEIAIYGRVKSEE